MQRLCKCSILTVPFKANDMKLVEFFFTFSELGTQAEFASLLVLLLSRPYLSSIFAEVSVLKTIRTNIWDKFPKISSAFCSEIFCLFFLRNVRKANFFNLPFQFVLSETNERTKETRIAHRLDRPLVKRLMGPPQGHICRFYCWKII